MIAYRITIEMLTSEERDVQTWQVLHDGPSTPQNPQRGYVTERRRVTENSKVFEQTVASNATDLIKRVVMAVNNVNDSPREQR